MLLVKDFLTDQQIMRSAGAPQSPLVSVILPTYARHASGRLTRAVESVLAQTFADFELIVVDDGSTDGSSEFIERCRARDPRVVHVRHEMNSGLSALRVNEGMELARGRFLAFQFDDDSWRPGALAALVRGAGRQQGRAVVVGHCHATKGGQQVIYPDRELILPHLYERNSVANNSVLVPRSLVELCGMYDCHIAMRRNCDWDLWIRYGRYVPFAVVEDVISDVEAGLPDSLGVTMPYDVSLVRLFHSARRDHILTPSRWREYEVDGLRAGEVEIEGEFRRRIYEEQIVPYYLKHRHHFPQIEGFAPSPPARRKTALYANEEDYGPLNEILKNHDEMFRRRGSYRVQYQPQPQVEPNWVKEADILLLIRAFQANATNLLRQAQDAGIPVGYFLDDDFLTLHELGDAFAFLAPGAPAHRRLTEMLEGADAVWVSSRALRDSVTPINPRIVTYNGSIQRASLPQSVRPREAGKPLRVGCTSGSYRQEELRHLWEALARFSHERGDGVVFEFWGIDVSALPPLASPVVRRPFSHSYALYLERLRESGFDVMLTPLLGEPRARLAKAPNKYYLTAAAGALGIFSDVQPYEMLPCELTCLKVENTVEAWYGALREAADMPAARFDLMRQRMLEHVREEFTETAELDTHEAALRATEFHAQTRRARYADGRPRVLLYCPAAETRAEVGLLRHRVELMRDYGVEALVVFDPVRHRTSGDSEVADSLTRMGIETETLAVSQAPHENPSQELRAAIKRHSPALVHSFVLAPTLGAVCNELGVPHVAAPSDLEDGLFLSGDFRYCDTGQSETLLTAERLSRLLGAEGLCARGLVSQEFFDLGVRHHLEALGGETEPTQTTTTRVVVVCASCDGAEQLKAVAVLGSLARKGLEFHLDVYSDNAPPTPRAQEWRAEAARLGVADRFDAHEYVGDDTSVFRHTDVLLNVSGGIDFPHAVKTAMASGALVVTAPAVGVSELVLDGVSGVLCLGDSSGELAAGLERALRLTKAKREKMTEQARRVARSEFHPRRAANDLFWSYNRALELALTSRDAGHARAPESRKASYDIWEQPSLPASSHVPITNWRQFMVVPRRENWIGLDVLVGTHMRAAQGSLRLRVRSHFGEVLREAAEDLAEVADNDWVSFRFPALRGASRQTFIAEFALEARNARTRVSLYENRPPENRARRLLRRVGAQASSQYLHCRMWYAG